MNYRTLALVLLTMTSFSAHAKQRWFEVELLVFQRNADIQDISEHLSSKEIVVDTSNSINLLKKRKSDNCVQDTPCFSKPNPTVITRYQFDRAGNNFRRLDSSHLELKGLRERLEKHAGFKPLLHMAWQMPMQSGRVAKPIHIFAGDNLAPQVLAQQTATTDQDNTLISNKTSDDKWAIDGNFKIYLDHYLYVDSQLIIRKAVTSETQKITQPIELIDDENGVQIAKEISDSDLSSQQNEVVKQTVIKEVLFDQTRRLRSEEIHYLDHPLMGVIIQIRKLPNEQPTN